MTARSHSVIAVELSECTNPDAGIFTWDLTRNLLFGDAAMADLYGLEASEVKQGLPIQRYIDRVHEDDRARVARSITESLLDDRPLQETYRVMSGTGEYIQVAGYGHAFCDGESNPILFSGIVVPAIDQPPDMLRH